jgi:hypothetical protein
MAAAMMASLPPPSTTMPTTLALIALALALPWTRIGRWGGGPAMMHLFHCHHGRHCCCQLSLHLRVDGAKEDCHGDRRGCHTNIHDQEEVGQHDPIGMEQHKQKQKQKQKQNQHQQHGGNVTATAPADSYACAAAAAASTETEAAAAIAQG